MSVRTTMPEPPTSLRDVEHHLPALKRPFIAGQYAEIAQLAAQQEWSHLDYLATLLEGEADLRRDGATKSRIRLARFPVIKTLEQFRWDWPTRMNRLQVQNHFRLAFIQDKANLILLGEVGLGKTWLACALGHQACREGYTVLYLRLPRLLQELPIAKGDGRYPKLMAALAKTALLILD